MKKVFFRVAMLSVALVSMAAGGAEGPPSWAYPMNPPGYKAPPDDGTVRRVPGSSVEMKLPEVRNLFSAPVWHPGDHPPLPAVVAQGRKPKVHACGYCHRADGPGGPENASLAGLPKEYIVQQMRDFKSGARNTAVPKRAPVALKLSAAKEATEAELEEAAAFFSALKPRAIIKVVEAGTVPRTEVAAWYLVVAAGGGTEPIGQRIIEVADSPDHFISRDSRATFIAYVPPGSVERGRLLATTGDGGKTMPCASCHGSDLKGAGAVPGIAGRSPTYAFRQLYDFKQGTRTGAESVVMKLTMEKLTIEDKIALAAYSASLAP
jgi:cytochrome c553